MKPEQWEQLPLPFHAPRPGVDWSDQHGWGSPLKTRREKRWRPRTDSTEHDDSTEVE